MVNYRVFLSGLAFVLLVLASDMAWCGAEVSCDDPKIIKKASQLVVSSVMKNNFVGQLCAKRLQDSGVPVPAVIPSDDNVKVMAQRGVRWAQEYLDCTRRYIFLYSESELENPFETEKKDADTKTCQADVISKDGMPLGTVIYRTFRQNGDLMVETRLKPLIEH